MYQINYDQGLDPTANPLPVKVTEAVSVAAGSLRFYEDPVGKTRTSQPQALIDTDFEYSVQPSKWEILTLVQNRPSFFPKGTGGNSIDLTSATISGNNVAPYSTITVTTTVAHNLSTGDVISVQDTLNAAADGIFIITVVSATQFTYLARGQINGSIIDSSQTTMYGGGIFPNSNIAVTSMVGNGASPSVITVTTSSAHALLPGAPVIINGATTTAVNGRWIILTVPTPTTFTFICATNTVTTVTLGSAVLYAVSQGYVQHRSTDGGVLITSGDNTVGSQLIRQTRRYFRYQSGKGIQFSTGLKMTPTYDIDSVTASGTTATVTTVQNHNMQAGATIRVEGVEVAYGTTNPYNGTFLVVSVTGVKSFTYTMTSVPITTSPTPNNAYVTCTKWTGGVVRSGLFDDQNGFYFEYDGNQMFFVRRDATKELAGRVSVSSGSNAVTGTGSKFRTQLMANDLIVIRGQTYEIASIASDTSMVITPAYRGSVNVVSGRYSKVQLSRFPQSQWNLDRCDGTGSSGYTLDVSRMQMAFIDYSWYGAGTIRWGFRTTNGDITYCHRVPMNNVNFAAYMRSGNLPGRFEASNYGYYSKLVAGAAGTRGSALGSTDTTLYVEDAQLWPSAGYIFVQDGTNCELMQYTSVGTYNTTAGGYAISGLTRRTTYSLAGVNTTGTYSATAYTIGGTSSSVTFTPDAGVGGAGTAQVSVQFVRNTCAPSVSHWGVSVIMDGRYDDDKSFVFTVGMNRNLAIVNGVTRPMLAIRIAPSADSGNGRNFGIRELVNRMQLVLDSIGVSSNGQFLVEGILNPSSITSGGITFPTDWQTVRVGSGSLAQVIFFDGTGSYQTTAATATGTVNGGDKIFSFYTELGSNYSVTTSDLSRVRDLGTSILSGDGSASAPCYPNGPDMLVIVARNIETTGTKNIACRISWTEAQA